MADSKEIVLASSFDELDRLEPFLNDLQKWAGFGDEDYARIMLTLSEAAMNAIVHGNREETEKQVEIKANLKNSTLSISVKDEGEGFDPDEVPNPLDEENLMKVGGRGVYLIQEYADEVIFSEDATRITMKFELEEIA